MMLQKFFASFRAPPALPAGGAPTLGLVCAYCGGRTFRAGPEGCGATNILCANPDCRHWFSDLGIPGQPLYDLKRIEPTPDEKAVEAAESRAREDARRAKIHNEGRALYRAGMFALHAATKNENYGGAAHPDNVLRLAGYIDEMHYQNGLVPT